MPNVGQIANSQHNATATHYTWNNSTKSWQFANNSSSRPERSFDQVLVATKRVKPSGWMPPTPYHRVIRSTWLNPMAWVHQRTSVGPHAYAVGSNAIAANFPSEPAAVPASKITEMQFKVLDRVRQQKIQLGVAMAELPKTISLVRETAYTITRSIHAARRGRWKDVASILNIDREHILSRSSNSKRWLTMQYGWTPLLSDVDSSARVLAEGLGDWRYGAAYSAAWPIGPATPINPSYMQYKRTGQRVLKLRMDFEVDNSNAMTFDQLGLANPLEIAWELVPFSFVVDWFVPIGDWLSSLGLLIGSDFKGGTFTDYYSYVDELLGFTDIPINATYTQTAVCGHRRSVKRINRQVISSPLPSIINPPNFDQSLTRMTSGIALLSEAVDKARRRK